MRHSLLLTTLFAAGVVCSAQVAAQQAPNTEPAPPATIEHGDAITNAPAAAPDGATTATQAPVPGAQPMVPDGLAADPTAIGDGAAMERTATGADQARELIGRDVVSATGEDMGDVKNLIVDGEGRIKAAVIEWGGFLGLGTRERVVPWDQTRLDDEDNRLVVDMTEDEIRGLPEYQGEESLADLGSDVYVVE